MTVARAIVVVVVVAAVSLAVADVGSAPPGRPEPGSDAVPIEHLVVIVQENVSFDHYFATYPIAENAAGEPEFSARFDTPPVEGLDAALRAPNNPNSVQPFRLSRTQALTCSQIHGYAEEQSAVNGGAMDHFVEALGNADDGCPDYGHGPGIVMGYYDGNTVTALWNYAQNFAMSDNSFGTGFGPSTVGALNIVSGETGGFAPAAGVSASGFVVDDPRPAFDSCARGATTFSVAGTNIGMLLSERGVSWGWFQGGFADCTATHTTIDGVQSVDYISHHNPFQYYEGTANAAHVPPATVAEIGNDGRANHQYDLADFWHAVDAGSMPTVSYLKAPAFQDGHAGYSSPLDEQQFLVQTLNRLQQTDDWSSTAVVIVYDDSGGWYDHVQGPLVSFQQDSIGLGPRLPLMVISPWAKQNYVSHELTDQTDVTHFIEQLWLTETRDDVDAVAPFGGLADMFDFSADSARRPVLLLDPITGTPVP